MASDILSNENNRSKRAKLSTEEIASSSVAEDLSAHARINSFEGFKFKRILSDNSRSKSVFIESTFETTGECAVILLEKMHIIKDNVNKLLNNADLALNLKSDTSPNSNEIHYACYPKVDRGDIKTTIICPATTKHVEKYLFQPLHVIHETSEIYNNIVLPHILSSKFSIQWINNILEHKSEVDRIVFEDRDPETGFILIPDYKWDDSEKGHIYLTAISLKSIKSLRDLNSSHLPLLENIRSKSLNVISKKYNVSSEKLRVYVHYPPSYYHLHVHFSSIHKIMPGTQFERAHLLDTIIENIQLCPSFYAKATLTYTLKENDPLFVKLKEASVIKT